MWASPRREVLAVGGEDRLGAHIVVDPSRESLHDRVMALTGGRGAEVVCEAVGKPELVAEAFAMVRPTGLKRSDGMMFPGNRSEYSWPSGMLGADPSAVVQLGR